MITACMCVNACVRVLNINNTSKKGKREDSSEERRERDMVKSIHRYALVSIGASVEHIVTRTSTRRRLLVREMKEETRMGRERKEAWRTFEKILS